MPDFVILQKKLGYTFKDERLLKRALTHRSVEKDNNERLEFLGDSVLNFVMSDLLYQRYAELSEGELSRVRAGLVNGDMLADIARGLGLGPHLLLGQGEMSSGGQDRDSILADTLEAIIGAVYLDGGMQQAQRYVIDLFHESRLDDLKNAKLEKDPKSALQEWTQARHLPLPHYDSTVTGLAHEQTFHVTCRVQGIASEGHGESTNRRKAEQLAAKELFDLLGQGRGM